MSRPVSRRLFLRSSGVALGLPYLHSAFRSRATAQACAAAPVRFLAWYTANGMRMEDWTPRDQGTGWTVTPILEPLEPHRAKTLVLTGLASRAGESIGAGDHASGTGAFLTAVQVRKTDGTDIRNGVSVDQAMAQHLDGCTRFSSIQLGIDGGGSTGNCDSGYSCAYSRNISWAAEATPLPKIVNPRVVFDRLFSDLSPAADPNAQRRQRYRQSVLDYVLDEATTLRTRLGRRDQAKLDEYLTAVREIERRIESVSGGMQCAVPGQPPDDLPTTEHIDLMTDLQVLALQCDVTRVGTFMLANAGSNRNYGFIGASGGHHDLAHHQRNSDKLRKLTIINRWEMERFAVLLDKMDQVIEEDGSTLLDNSVVLLSSEISDGDRHNHDDLPVVLAGGGRGALSAGRHVVYDSGETMGDLFVSCLRIMGVNADRFGDDGNGPLAQLAV